MRLLNCLINQFCQYLANTFTVPTKTTSAWNDEESNESRRSSSSSTNLQPPPAHQHQPLTRSTSQTQQQTYTKPQVIPGTSSTLTPIDLSSRFVNLFIFSHAILIEWSHLYTYVMSQLLDKLFKDFNIRRNGPKRLAKPICQLEWHSALYA